MLPGWKQDLSGVEAFSQPSASFYRMEVELFFAKIWQKKREKRTSLKGQYGGWGIGRLGPLVRHIAYKHTPSIQCHSYLMIEFLRYLFLKFSCNSPFVWD